MIVALGSNLGGAFATPKEAVEVALRRLDEIGLKVVARSRLWRSAAWPDDRDPPYVNAVAIVESAMEAHAAMAALNALEMTFGRERGAANAPRTLDLDLIAYGRMVADERNLVLPHPRAAERLFVMGPLAEIAPDWVHPTLRMTAEALAQKAVVGADARPMGSDC